MADAETLSAPVSTPVAATPVNATAAYVVMSRITATSSGAVIDGMVTLATLTIDNPGTAGVAAGRVYLSTIATTTLPTNAMEIGRTKGSLWSAGTTTTIVLFSGTTTQRSVLTTTPAYIYIVFDMLSTEGTKTTSAHVTGIGLVTTGGDTNPGAMNLSSNVITLAAGGVKATVVSCFDCHGDNVALNSNTMDGPRSGATGSFLGSHNKHVGSLTYLCTSCHISAASTYTTGHRDGNINMNAAGLSKPGGGTQGTYSKAVSFPQTTNPLPMGTCNSTYCHSNGVATYSNPTWGGAPMNAQCTGCHGGNSAAPVVMGGSHLNHINSAGSVGRLLNCGDCHNATVSAASDRNITTPGNHANGSLNVKFDNLANINRNSDNPTYSGISTTATSTGASVTPGTYGVCSNVYCHSIGNLDYTTKVVVTAGSASFRTPDWNTTPLGCAGCHGDQALKAYPTYATGSAGSTTANSHPKHIESAQYTCNLCHVTTTLSTTITAATMTLIPNGAHVNRIEDVSFATIGSMTGSYDGAAKTCSATYCHGTGPSVAWGGTVSCPSCHSALSGAHSKHIYTTAGAVYGSLSSNVSTTEYWYGCGNCHPALTSSHVNGTINIDIARGVSGLKLLNSVTTTVTGTGVNTTCNGVYCHSDGKGTFTVTPAWGSTFPTYNSCGQCHGNSPTADAHAAHTVGIHYDDVFNGTSGLTPSTGNVGVSAGHGDPAQSTTLNCYLCHSNSFLSNKARNKYGTLCLTCHTSNPDSTTNAMVTADVNKRYHIDGVKTVVFSGVTITSKAQIRDPGLSMWTRATGTYKKGTAASRDTSVALLSTAPSYTGAKNCTVVCHNNAIINWTSTPITCDKCHTDLP